jgi:hypothetical protein
MEAPPSLTKERDDLKRLLGTNYDHFVDPWRRQVDSVSRAISEEPIVTVRLMMAAIPTDVRVLAVAGAVDLQEDVHKKELAGAPIRISQAVKASRDRTKALLGQDEYKVAVQPYKDAILTLRESKKMSGTKVAATTIAHHQVAAAADEDKSALSDIIWAAAADLLDEENRKREIALKLNVASAFSKPSEQTTQIPVIEGRRDD